MSKLFLVGGDKGNMGKSTTCKILAELLHMKGYNFTLFESDRTKPDVKLAFEHLNEINANNPNYVPVKWEYAVFSESEEDIDAAGNVFNSAITELTLVNMAAETFIALKNWMQFNGVIEAAVECGVDIYLWLVTNGAFDSLSALKMHLKHFKSSVHYVVVRNLGISNNWGEFEDDYELHQLLERYKATIIDLPKLVRADEIFDILKRKKLTFSKAANSGEFLPILQRQRIKNFIREAFQNIEESGILEGLNDAQ
ncbi:MAG: hypothetical protein KME49_22635 [Brasilonema octagenarum HA4186-MV1]|jgi:hypothetical protein|nr:hypothetical protein [Brasilonema octagenarum HA4186-MV1]